MVFLSPEREALHDIGSENERAIRRLKENVEKAQAEYEASINPAEVPRRNIEHFVALDGTWHTEKMKIYYGRIMDLSKVGLPFCESWRNDPEMLELLEKYNREIMVSESGCNLRKLR